MNSSLLPQAETTPNLSTEQNLAESALIAQVKLGNEKAFEELMRLHDHDKLIANYFSIKFQWIPVDQRVGLVEECTQDTFVEAYWNINKYEYHAGKPFLAWLYGIAHHRYCKAYKQLKHKKENEILFADLPEQWDFEGRDKSDYVEELDLFLRAFQLISREDQEAILLHFYQEQTFEAIGKRQGRTPQGVKQAVYRFRQKLQSV